jgi:hypothetical protein
MNECIMLKNMKYKQKERHPAIEPFKVCSVRVNRANAQVKSEQSKVICQGEQVPWSYSIRHGDQGRLRVEKCMEPED